MTYEAALDATERSDLGIKYPQVEVPLVGEDGNAMAILGRVRRALRFARDDDGQRLVPDEEVAAFLAEATGGDYDHLLQTVMRLVKVS